MPAATSLISLTANEIAILKGARDNDYGSALEGECPWVFAVIDSSGLDAKVARGAIASLITKGVIEISDYGGKKRADDMVLTMSDAGIEVAQQALG